MGGGGCLDYVGSTFTNEIHIIMKMAFTRKARPCSSPCKNRVCLKQDAGIWILNFPELRNKSLSFRRYQLLQLESEMSLSPQLHGFFFFV